MKSLTKHQQEIVMWIDFLFMPECNIKSIQEKRNRYLMMLSLSAITGKIPKIFQKPPNRNLQLLENIPRSNFNHMIWQQKIDNVWNDICKNVDHNYSCFIHSDDTCCSCSDNDQSIGTYLDDQFRLFLNISRLINLLPNQTDRLKATKWIQQLCTITSNFCLACKGVRNDYMISLLGHVNAKMLLGPFARLPPDKLKPLSEAVQIEHEKPVIDLTHSALNELASNFPEITEGAFAVIGITSDMINGKH